ncbi:armadillo-type protein [Mycena vulgaris]|nr:armadillo-type protein [Mycena vulgaris]
MPPLPRQQTRESIYSWWSDNNLTGPNINLHAATKPLLRHMHDRQALALIRKNRGTPLSSKDMEIYTSYLWFKYVSPSTKTAIMTEINERVDSEEDARTVANSLALYHVDAMLESPNEEFRSQTINPCTQLVSILQDDKVEVAQSGVHALYCLAQWRDSAQALVDAGVLECTETLLSSGEASIRRLTWGILARLLQQAPALPAIADSVVKLFNQLAWLLRDEARHGTALDVMESATHALFWSIRFSAGAQEAILLDCLRGLLESRNFEVRKLMCEMLRDLASRKPTVPMIADPSMEICKWLASMLRDEHFGDIILGAMESTARALFSIIRFPEGPQEAILLNCLSDLLKSRELEIRKWTCEMLGDLASHKPTVPMIADPGIEICKRLASMLRHKNFRDTTLGDMESAARGLFSIFRFPEGPQEAILLDCLSNLLKSRELEVRKWTWKMLGDLASHKPTIPLIADPGIEICKRLASILREEARHGTALDVIESAARALFWITRFSQGPQEAILLDCLSDLLQQLAVPKARIEKLLFWAVFDPRQRIARISIFLMRDTTIEVIQSAVEALSCIATYPEGAQAVVDANVLDWVVEQHGTQNLESPRRMLENMLTHTLDSRHCQQLVSSDLRVKYLEVMTWVLRTLSIYSKF